MKTRQSFVSNSSSSSFFCVIERDAANEFKKSLEKEEKKVFLEFFSKKDILGKTCFVWADHIYTDDWESEEKSDAFYSLVDKINKLDKNKCFFLEV